MPDGQLYRFSKIDDTDYCRADYPMCAWNVAYLSGLMFYLQELSVVVQFRVGPIMTIIPVVKYERRHSFDLTSYEGDQYREAKLI